MDTFEEDNNIIDEESDNESVVDDHPNIETRITNKAVISVYGEFLQNNKLLLNPEYQRDLSWSIEKMNTFIDTIMKGWIVPNYVIYKLSNSELKNNPHQFECIDGQHRLLSIKWYIEGTPYPGTNRYVHWSSNGERVYYNLSQEKMAEIKTRSRQKIVCRNLTDIEKLKFDFFDMSFHMVESKNGSLSIGMKCDIFNRLQNGEKVSSYDKLKNLHTNTITDTIRTKHLLSYMKTIKFCDKININNPNIRRKRLESFNIYFLIRSFLIIDKKNLDVNYLDLNIKKYLEANNGQGTPSVKLNNNIDILLPKVLEVINYISSSQEIVDTLIPELVYIFICVYANYDINGLEQTIKWLIKPVNRKQFEKLNDIRTYKISSEKVTSAIHMNKYYNNLIKIIFHKNNPKNEALAV